MPVATKQYETWEGVPLTYYQVTRAYKARADGWTDKLLDYGYNELAWVPGPSGSPIQSRVPIVDPAGAKVSRPYALDGHGLAVPSPSGAAAVLERRPYRQAVWSALE